ncbi:PAS domain S-box protein [Persicimonas caeni]|uniref:histidine kinase n=1 Tax=Persicimonas caeni TaxID=2292766 RepID=A0A4Y6PN33_PERCE|nr:hybrid sensor histidine kinase/response regulator [Persicimonas caeni]QDG49650.1 PAS domain S-box protein [Persicimonas caeni]QED30871.1 PAS domain S-box protein [Persicimonas caeni]
MGNDSSASNPLIFHPWVDRLLPANHRNSTGIEGLRARVLVLSALAVCVWGPIFGGIAWLLDDISFALMYLGASVLVCPILYLCLKHRSVTFGGNALAFILMALLAAVAYDTGGVDAPTLKWLPLVPVIGYIFGGWRSCVGWIAASFALVAGYTAAEAMGVEFVSKMQVDEESLTNLIGLLALVILLPQLFVLNAGLQRWLVERVRREEEVKRRIEAELRAAKDRALQRSKEGLKSLIAHSPDGIVVFRKGKVVATNPAFRKMLGYEGEEALLSSMLVSLVASNERAEFGELLDQICAGEDIPYKEYCFLRADGEMVVAEVTGTHGAYDGRDACFCLVRDVTQRKEVQGKMMHLDRMNAVGTLAAGVAHEINNPLAYVHSNTEFLLSRTSKYRKNGAGEGRTDFLSHKDLVEALEDIREGTDRIRTIVADLGTFSAPETKLVGPLDVCELMQSALKMADNHLRHRAKLVTRFDEVPAVEANEANLAQVFLNLVVNAAQAIPEGAVDQNEVRVTIRYDEAADQVVVEVADTGEGIADAVKTRIFDPFFSTKGQDEGMGLGLFICRNIVRDHDGEIGFETTPGQGSIFRVLLPASTRQADPSREFETPVSTEGYLGRALIIDDEPGVCRTVARVLGSGFEPVAVHSGREALDLLERDTSFEVVICDLLMPDVSGVEVYEHIRDHVPALEQRMVFVTGGTFTQRSNDFVRTTDRPVILKPFDIKEFREVVAGVCAA